MPMPPHRMPAAEHTIDAALVTRLLTDQHPDLAGLPLRELAEGWDNAMFRLGDDWTVRIPRRAVAAELMRNEQRCLPQLAPRLPLPIPVPERVGEPACGFPWPWSVCRYLPGRVAAIDSPHDLDRAALTLGEFLAALHVAADADAPVNAVRGVPLEQRAEVMASRLASLRLPRAREIESRFADALAVPEESRSPVWLHGDLHTANLLVHDGVVSAVIDFGDITSGDRATDLAVAWMLFPASSRARFREACRGVDDALWQRAHGWALMFSVVYLATSSDNPTMRQIGERTLRETLADTL